MSLLALGQLHLVSASGALDDAVRHVGSKDLVPRDEEGLGIVVLVPLELMVDVMVGTVVVKQELERVPRHPERAVHVDSLDGREAEEVDARAGGHPGEEEGHRPPDCVEEEALHGVVVEGTVGVGGDEGVVDGVDVLVQELVDVHVSVAEVLP